MKTSRVWLLSKLAECLDRAACLVAILEETARRKQRWRRKRHCACVVVSFVDHVSVGSRWSLVGLATPTQPHTDEANVIFFNFHFWSKLTASSSWSLPCNVTCHLVVYGDHFLRPAYGSRFRYNAYTAYTAKQCREFGFGKANTFLTLIPMKREDITHSHSKRQCAKSFLFPTDRRRVLNHFGHTSPQGSSFSGNPLISKTKALTLELS